MSPTGSADSFGLLADETRLDIIEALAEASKKPTGDRAFTFSELQDETGVKDSGQFNYHLNKLVGRFIEKTEAGYRLNYAGIQVAGAVLSGFYRDPGESISAHELWSCPLCEEPVEATYEMGLLQVGCANDHTFADLVPPRVFEDRDIEIVVETVAIAAVGRLRQAQRGCCPLCFGHVEWSIVEPGGDGPPTDATLLQGQCRTCGVPYAAHPGTFVLWDPAVQSRLHEYGVAVWEDPARWVIEGAGWTADPTDGSGQSVIVHGELEPCTITATVNERGEILDIDIADK